MIRDERDLPEELACPPGRELLALPADLGLALEQHEELAAALPLAGQHLPLPEVDLVGDRGHLPELLLGEPGEERHLRDRFDLRVLAKPHSHGASLSGAQRAVTSS